MKTAIKTQTYKQIIPFSVKRKVPNAETQAAFDEVEAMIRGEIPKPPYKSADELFAEMRANGEI